jgi:hypothetical protein
MEKLKAAIADKVLEMSSMDGNEMKTRLERINRFRDFANACQALSAKYPAIEQELLRMVDNNDFDTKVASSRVDTIIRLADSGCSPNVQPARLEEVAQDPAEADSVPDQPIAGEDVALEYQEETEVPVPEDAEYEEVELAPEEKEYTPFEDVPAADVTEPVRYREVDLATEPSVKPQMGTAKETAKRGLLMLAITAGVVVLIFLIVLIINHTEAFLWGLGIIIVAAIVILYFIKKQKGNETE